MIQGNHVVDIRNLVFTQVFQLVNEQGLNELKYYYFTTPNRKIDLSNDQQLLTLPCKRQISHIS